MEFPNRYEQLFYYSLRIRMVEERIIKLYPSDKIQSPVHLSIGQEAVAVGLCETRRAGDLIFGSYRSHAPEIPRVRRQAQHRGWIRRPRHVAETMIDTVGIKIGPFAMIDMFGTPYTSLLRVAETDCMADDTVRI